MGLVRMGLPEDLTLFLKEKLNANILIETGTYYGGTAVWASRNFKAVHTIELSEEIYKVTSEKYADVKNISFHYGDSRRVLQKILQGTDERDPIIYWLDAHWSSGNTYGENDQCPLIKELKIIEESKNEACILIDDARLFLAPPPLPNKFDQYPGIQEIIGLYNQDKFITVHEDVIIIVPQKLKVPLQEYLQKQTTLAWQAWGQKPELTWKGILKGTISNIRQKLRSGRG